MKKIILMMLGACYALDIMAQNTTTPEYGKNIVTVSPIQLVESDLLNNHGSDVCLNIGYERIFGNGHFGVKLPVSFSLKNPFFYIMPTLKLYPTKQGVVRYAVGPQFFFGTGTIKYNYHSYNGNGYYQNMVISETRTQFGFMINNSVNFTIIQSIYLGMDMGIGINYYDSMEDNDNENYYYGYYPNNDSPFNPIVQFNFSMGYRF
ncbi:MAG TPA: hypothetical protein VJY62_22115 [Bacteroidia bacterium]|nr:hypothetical protein [Bacteroidia bacterium]